MDGGHLGRRCYCRTACYRRPHHATDATEQRQLRQQRHGAAIVVTDPGFDDPVSGVLNVGAVYLFSPTGALVSTLRGSFANDAIGRRIIVLSNGNYLIANPGWGVSEEGSVTFCTADMGCDGVVSAANSLVGTQNGDAVGTFAYNPSPIPQDRTLIVGLPLENRVVLLNYVGIFQGGFE